MVPPLERIERREEPKAQGGEFVEAYVAKRTKQISPTRALALGATARYAGSALSFGFLFGEADDDTSMGLLCASDFDDAMANLIAVLFVDREVHGFACFGFFDAEDVKLFDTKFTTDRAESFEDFEA